MISLNFISCWFFYYDPINYIQCYIVYLGAHSHGPTPSSVDLETATSSHYDLLGSILGRYIQ